METFNYWLQAIISILSGMAVLIPMIATLVKYIKANAKEKNWSKMLTLVMALMADAEKEFSVGADRKEWVKGQLRTLANTIDYDIDWDVVDDMIDRLCDLSKEINV